VVSLNSSRKSILNESMESRCFIAEHWSDLIDSRNEIRTENNQNSSVFFNAENETI
jgi:hypothetical protein